MVITLALKYETVERQREMLRRVGLLAVDETQAFTILPVGEALASIVHIIQNDNLTGLTYNVYPLAVQGYCTPGLNLYLTIRVANNGTIDGALWIKIYGNGLLLVEYTTPVVLPPGGSVDWSSPLLTMPTGPYNMIVEAGH